MPGKMNRLPPKEFFDKMSKRIKSGNPNYTEDQINATVADIWHNKISPAKKAKYNKIRARREAREGTAMDKSIKLFVLPENATGEKFELIDIEKAVGEGQERPGHKYHRREWDPSNNRWNYFYHDDAGQEKKHTEVDFAELAKEHKDVPEMSTKSYEKMAESIKKAIEKQFGRQQEPAKQPEPAKEQTEPAAKPKYEITFPNGKKGWVKIMSKQGDMYYIKTEGGSSWTMKEGDWGFNPNKPMEEKPKAKHTPEEEAKMESWREEGKTLGKRWNKLFADNKVHVRLGKAYWDKDVYSYKNENGEFQRAESQRDAVEKAEKIHGKSQKSQSTQIKASSVKADSVRDIMKELEGREDVMDYLKAHRLTGDTLEAIAMRISEDEDVDLTDYIEEQV